MSGPESGPYTATLDSSLAGQPVTTTVTPDASPDGFTASTTFTTPGGTVVAASGGSNQLNTNDTKVGQSNVVHGVYTISSSTDPALTTADSGDYELFANAVGLEYANFGVWNFVPCGPDVTCTPAYVGTFGGGQQDVSPTASMPATGSATYSGGATGYVVQPSTINSNNVGQFYGASSLTANFATNAITGAITAIQAYSPIGSGNSQPYLGTINDIGLSGTISGSAYSGTAGVTGSAGTAFDISGATGSLTGAFYGPAAEETAGVFDLSGGTNETTLVGSFGAKTPTPPPTPTPTTASWYSETGTVGGSPPNYTLSVDTALHGKFIDIAQGDPATESLATPGGTVTMTNPNSPTTETRTGVAGVDHYGFTVTESTDPNVAVGANSNLQNYAGVNNLQYTVYGTWDLDPSSSNTTPLYSGTFAGGYFGVAQTASMPTSGSATYTGGATGFIVQPNSTNASGIAGAFYGSSSLTANFASGNVTGSITGINAYQGNTNTLVGTVNDIGLTATISGSAYAGTASVTGAAGTAFDISGATGPLVGGFYGPAANETAGVFNLTGGTNHVSVTGAFGAAKPVAPSDRRLKVDIEPAGSLPNGLKLYAWRYLGGSHRFTGVMAQDLLGDPRFANAVAVDREGLMRVDYDKIGYRPSHFALMRKEGEAALARYRQSLN